MTRRFIVIETNASDLEAEADQIREVARLIEDGFLSGLERNSRFERYTPINYFTASDAIKAIRKNDEE